MNTNGYAKNLENILQKPSVKMKSCTNNSISANSPSLKHLCKPPTFFI